MGIKIGGALCILIAILCTLSNCSSLCDIFLYGFAIIKKGEIVGLVGFLTSHTL